MTVQQIDRRAASEAAVFETAKRIRELLDAAAKANELPDGRDFEGEVLQLVTEEA